ncbi:MAG TPA: TIM-barrel domain-containing protein [Gaiellaceae bacterium]|nr:TIM-barrel domain-containing protein [Gaiellaceae bacterium]
MNEEQTALEPEDVDVADAASEPYEFAYPIVDGTRRFHPFEEVLAVEPEERAVRLRVRSRGGLVQHVRLSFCDPSGLRVQWAPWPPGAHETAMLDGAPAQLPLRVEELSDRIVVDAGGPAAVVHRSPWRLEFGPYRTEPADSSLVTWVAPPSGWAHDERGPSVNETFALDPGEELWGTGERFVGPAVRGRRVAHWIHTALGTNCTDRVHKSIPLVVSSRGYGLFVHAPERAVLDLGCVSTASATVLVESPEWDGFVFLGTPKEVLRRYTAVTGRPPELPDWTYGVWISRCMYESRAQVEAELDAAERHGLPVSVVGIDPLWLARRKRLSFDSCDFDVDEDAFGPVDELAARLHERGVKLCLWVNPYVDDGSPAYRPELLVDGGRCRDPWYPQRAVVDFTGEGADWWRERMERLLAAGVDCFKLDYGEMLPESARHADGRTGAQTHNVYPLLASAVAREAGSPVCWTRGATAGSQRYPVHWPGDTQSTWAGLSGAVRGGLASAWSGLAYWTTDIAGHHRRDLWRPRDENLGFRLPDPELYRRWTQVGMLCTHTRFHGIGPREPWYFGDEAVAVAVRFAELRRRLLGYLRDCAAEAAATGTPILRPVALEFPEDRGAWRVDHEFLLGPGLLVVPVLAPGGRVDVYVPPGDWTDHFTGERYGGPGWVAREDVPFDELPLLVRDGYAPFAPE